MVAYTRFRFDQRFDPITVTVDEPEPEVIVDPLDVPAVTEREVLARIEAAEWRAYGEGLERGRSEGETSADKRIEAETAQALVLLTDRLAELDGRFEDTLHLVERQGTAVLVAMTRRFAPSLLDRIGRAEVERLAVDALKAAGMAPVLRVRVHPDLAGPVRVLLDRETPNTGFAGTIDVTPDPSLARHALDAAWEAGGVRYDPAEIERTVAQLCDRALDSLAESSTPRQETATWQR